MKHTAKTALSAYLKNAVKLNQDIDKAEYDVSEMVELAEHWLYDDTETTTEQYESFLKTAFAVYDAFLTLEHTSKEFTEDIKPALFEEYSRLARTTTAASESPKKLLLSRILRIIDKYESSIYQIKSNVLTYLSYLSRRFSTPDDEFIHLKKSAAECYELNPELHQRMKPWHQTSNPEEYGWDKLEKEMAANTPVNQASATTTSISPTPCSTNG